MLSIGTFSRLAQLSVRVLRHYDEIGLLKPAHTSRAGYRFYTSEQLVDVNRIVALKELGLSLEQVATLMKEKHPVEAIAGMLRLEKARAEQERSEAERRLRDIDRRLAELSDLGRLSEIDVIEKTVAETPFLAYRATVAELPDAYALMNEIIARCESLGLRVPFVGVAHDRFFDTRDLDIELGYPVGRPERVELGGGRVMSVRSLPAEDRMISAFYLGVQEDGHRRTHAAIAAWLEHHRCEFAGPGRELVHDAGGSQSTVEIQYPIADRSND
jgi:DNA-binding transcriptional MerR regulator